MHQSQTTTALLIDPECWSGRDLNQRPPAGQTDAYPTELTGRRLAVAVS